MLPGDTKAMTPSGLRLGVQELTRHGMGTGEMEEVARLFARVLIASEDPATVKRDVNSMREGFQQVRYCFED
jgi:glycine hydroxymethyltransferase